MSMRILDDQNYGSGKPTEKAYTMAASAGQMAWEAETKATNQSYDALMAKSLSLLCTAVGNLAVGLRATYILLEKIERDKK